MSYLVLARKWRPQTFDDVIGQEHITGTLKKAIDKNRVAHAFIFSGTRGVGKTTTARILARALNCEKGPTPAPCGECSSCKGILGGSSFDVLEIDGASNNSVDDIRGLRENVGYSSMGGKYRIFVIDEVHMLSKPAFNALLKTLEEPPQNVIFIFATTEPQKIPATIHSRCQRYDFRRIGPEHIMDRLLYICEQEKIAFEKSALMLVARKADGSMRDALSLLDQVYSFCPDRITEKEARGVLGLVGMEIYTQVMDAVAAKKSETVLAAVQEVLYQGFDLHEFVMGLEEHVRNMLFAGIDGALAALSMDKEQITVFAASASRFSEGDLMRMMEIIRKTGNDLKWSAFPRFAVELLLLKLVHLDSTVSLEQILSSLGHAGAESPASSLSGEKKKFDIVTPAAVKAELHAPASVSESRIDIIPPTTEIPQEPDAERLAETTLSAKQPGFEENTGTGIIDIAAQWPAFLEVLLRDRPNLGTFLSLGKLAKSTPTSAELVYSQKLKFQFSEVTKKQSREDIGRIAREFFGFPLDMKISLDAAKDEPPASQGNAQIKTSSFIDNEIEKEPIIQTVLDVFDGELIG